MEHINIDNVKSMSGGYDEEGHTTFVELTVDGCYESSHLRIDGDIEGLHKFTQDFRKAISEAAASKMVELETRTPEILPQKTPGGRHQLASYPERYREALKKIPHLTIYVPKRDTFPSREIAPKSGIVGVEEPAGSDQVKVYYEGNIHGASNIKTLADKCDQAAGRLLSGYPTVAFGYFRKEDLSPVGTFYIREHIIGFTDPEEIKAWMGWEEILASELMISQ